MEWKTILISVVLTVVLLIVLTKVGLAAKIGLSNFESETV